MLRFAVGLLCLASFVPCQEEEGAAHGGEEVRRMKAAEAAKMKQMQEREKGEKGEKGEDDSQLTPEQRLARHVVSGAGQYCRFLASVTPRKLMPGQTGTLRVLATLQGHSVLPAPAPLEFVGQPQQGLVSLGSMSMQPAGLGKIEPGYLGRPVYENYAVMEIPVSMANTAQVGSKHSVAIDMKFDLYDGTSANALGRFLDQVRTEIEVGTVPDPAVPVAAARAVEAPKAEVPKVEPAAAGSANQEPVTQAAPVQANAVQPKTEPVAPAPSPSSPGSSVPMPVDEAGGPLPLPVWIGGGALLLGVVLLVARRK